MKRFLVFAGDCYYPSGGWNDFKSDHETLSEAFEATKVKGIGDWWHVVDTVGMRIIPDPDEND